MRSARLRIAFLVGLAWLAVGVPSDGNAQGWRPSGDRTRDSLDLVRDAEITMPDSVLQWVGMTREQFVNMGLRFVTLPPESLFKGPDAAHRSDAEMATSFFAREKDFQRLVAMFRADTSFDRVFVRSWDFSQEMRRLPPGRYAEYERLFARTGVVMVVREDDLVLLRTTTVHTFDRKGYAWSMRPVSPIVRDETTVAGDGAWRVFKPLKPRWSIYFQESS
jgi:hypothetical protein